MGLKKTNFQRVTGIIIIAVGFAITIIFSCTHEPDGISDFPEVCFEKEVLPIFQNSCGISGCHDQASAKDGYVFTSYNSIINTIKPGNPSESPAYTILTAKGDDRMPPEEVLPLQSRQTIRIWIEQGAQNTTCPDPGNNGDDNVLGRACFKRDILPVLVSSCGISGCHDDATSADGYSFTSYTGTLEAVTPGNPQESDLYETITEDDITKRMPPQGYDPLSREHIDSIYNWIQYGALNEDCREICDTLSQISFSSHVWPIIEPNCRSCHSGSNPSSGVLLTDYNTVSIIAENRLLNSVLRGTNGSSLMPPSGSLPECNIRQIELWVENGYQNN